MALPYPYSTFTTSRSFTYSYIHINPQDISKPYILFLHGFPGSSYDWRHQIVYFQKQGYGIIVPDLLGYGCTSKPLDVKAYSSKGMAEDFHEVLKSEGITQLVGIAHDWGSLLLSRLANYFPNLFTKLAFLDVGYTAPGHGLTAETVQFVNKIVKDSKGFEVFGYCLFFDEEGAAELMDEHIDSLQSLMHSTDNELGKKYMGATGGIRTWLSEGKIAEREEWLEPAAIEHDRKLFAKENGGYAAAINWYKAQLHNLNVEDENAIPEETHILKQPVLLITTDNFISASADFGSQMKAYTSQFETKKLEASHWVMLQRKNEVNEILGEFVAR